MPYPSFGTHCIGDLTDILRFAPKYQGFQAIVMI